MAKYEPGDILTTNLILKSDSNIYLKKFTDLLNKKILRL